ncbi:hypothetical protein MXB_1016, partial [Myxobolus squamalis]
QSIIVEYVGEIIRNELACVREKIYEKKVLIKKNIQNIIACMLKLNENYLIDATTTGGIARFINHSCDPNCNIEIIVVDKVEKAIVSSKRKIDKLEEITYDYKLCIEESENKIICMCNSQHCKKFLN